MDLQGSIILVIIAVVIIAILLAGQSGFRKGVEYQSNKIPEKRDVLIYYKMVKDNRGVYPAILDVNIDSAEWDYSCKFRFLNSEDLRVFMNASYPHNCRITDYLMVIKNNNQ